jgi:hypothetical protein
MSDTVRTMEFSWHAAVSMEDAVLIGTSAEERSTRRWRIHDLSWRVIERAEDMAIVDINWTYGPIHGGRPDDGRKFIERVLCDALGRSVHEDLRDHYPDVIVIAEAEGDFQEFVPPLNGG